MLILWDFLGNFGLSLNDDLTLMKRNMVVIDKCYYQHIVNFKSLEFFLSRGTKVRMAPYPKKCD
jgi:hypothetical protein